MLEHKARFLISKSKIQMSNKIPSSKSKNFCQLDLGFFLKFGL